MMIDRLDRATTSRAFAVGLALVFMGVSGSKAEAADKPPRYVELDASGKIIYASDVRGNRVPDFSCCGYRGGAWRSPTSRCTQSLLPPGVDNGPAIQAAIDQVAQRNPEERGIRGAVLLLAGRHEVSGSRFGSRPAASSSARRGDGPGGTALVARGTDRRPLITIGGRGERPVLPSWAILIADEYVPVGTRRFKLERVDTLGVGDRVIIEHPSTSQLDRFAGYGPAPAGGQGILAGLAARQDGQPLRTGHLPRSTAPRSRLTFP